LEVVTIFVISYIAGAVSFSQVIAWIIKGVDLRTVGTKTVSGTSLYRVAGFVPLAAAGLLDIGKGAVGPLLADPVQHPTTAAIAAGLAVVGHNWSPFLQGAGGRGISPSIGALAAGRWPGSLLLLAALGIGRLVKHTGLVSFVGMVALIPLLGGLYGVDGAAYGAAVTLPMLIKRVLGNEMPVDTRGGRVFVTRLLFDTDDVSPPRR
jgi:glycerol-3-phosphate acyltransferase PlsY